MKDSQVYLLAMEKICMREANFSYYRPRGCCRALVLAGAGRRHIDEFRKTYGPKRTPGTYWWHKDEQGISDESQSARLLALGFLAAIAAYEGR